MTQAATRPVLERVNSAPIEGDASPGCDHCGLPVPPALIDATAAEQFCCGGCRTAYEVIHGCGLEDYYRVRQALDGEVQGSTGVGDSYAAFDSEAFLAKHATRTAGGLMTIELRLEGVHCAACVWLVERLPIVVDGVASSRLSLATCCARVAWDPERTRLSAIAAALDRLGYAAHPSRDVSARDARLRTERRQMTRMAIAGALAGNNMLIALALYAGVFDGIAPQHSELFRWASMLVGWLSVLGPGSVFLRTAAANLRSRTSSLDQPIALALTVGAVAGTVNVVLSRGEVYFDSLSVLIFLLLVGRFLQSRQQRWATDAINSAISMTPDSCRVMRGGRTCVESVDALSPGDVVQVLPGGVFPTDGRVQSGRSSIDLSLLTGESAPRPARAGDEVFAGAVNVSGALQVAVSAVGDQTRVGQLQRLVMEGLGTRTPLLQFTDRIGRWFLVVVTMIATANAIAWTCLSGLGAAIDTTVAVLIVACPCAVGLATPLTMALTIGRASRAGVLIKSADVFERLARVTPQSPGLMFLDKTGTLTTGQFDVVAWHGEREMIPVVAAAESQSNHPLGDALSRYAERLETDESPSVRDVAVAHGFGLNCRWNGQLITVGSPRWVCDQCGPIAEPLRQSIGDAAAAGSTTVAVARGREVVAIVSLQDQLHGDTVDAVRWLASLGWRARVLSGDNQSAVDSLCARIGVDAVDGRGGATPEEKRQVVRAVVNDNSHQSPGEREPTRSAVVMIGDGVNDAAALTAADVGIAVHGGAETALAAADVYLSRAGIGEVIGLVRMARRTLRVVHRNLAISLIYNAVAVAMASAGLVTPLTAAILMPLSSATVLAAAIAGVTGDVKKNRSV